MLTPKQEQFCLEMIKPKANQSKAYRAAFNAKGMKAETVHSEASKLIKSPQITARIKELLEPVISEAQLTREQWIQDGLKLYRADPRKLFDKFGNTVPISELGDSEITLIEGFKFTEEYTKVRKSSGESDAVATGYTQDYKTTSYKTRHEYMGKILGYVKDTPWRKPLELSDDPTTAWKEIEQAFTRGDLSTDELTGLLRSRDFQLKVTEHDALVSRLAALEAALGQVLTQQKAGQSGGTA
ncbi:MAG: terminase small subunit [Nitrospira sp.]|nr:terminase small subunit [Nitrospira sp.]